MNRGQRWHHPMHLTIHWDRLHHFAPVAFETAVVVVKLDLVDPAQHRVEDPAR